MVLKELLNNVSVTKLYRAGFGGALVEQDIEINHIAYDSRKVQLGDCFVAIHGTTLDGQKFIGDAIERGAVVIVVDEDSAIPDSYLMHRGVVKILVPDSRIALALLSSNYYNHPSRRLKTVGVTGTNGKTTTSHIIRSIFEASGFSTGLIGTIEYVVGNEIMTAPHTTPGAVELNFLMNLMLQRGCRAVSMEVSSHSLDQSRTYGIDFDAAVFTNLTQDHLDYHRNMEEYFKAKQKLFIGLKPEAIAVVNSDDEYGKSIVDGCKAHIVTYGTKSGADIRAVDISLTINGTQFFIEYWNERINISTGLIGMFNLYNVLGAFAAGITLALPIDCMISGISNLKTVRGRFERITSTKGWTVIIDYAHTPDALEKCLLTIKEIVGVGGKVITVFGAGGDRDKAKRPLMGKVVSRLSDKIYLTSDNPRTENPDKIIDDIAEGIPKGIKVIKESNRRKAINDALLSAQSGDVVLVAGKGHEEYQIVGTERIHFSDREVVEDIIFNM